MVHTRQCRHLPWMCVRVGQSRGAGCAFASEVDSSGGRKAPAIGCGRSQPAACSKAGKCGCHVQSSRSLATQQVW